MIPAQHLDTYGMQLAMGDLPAVQADFENRVKDFNKNLNADDARTKAAHELYSLKWGPTKVPIYNLLGISCHIFPHQRVQLLAVTRWLSTIAKVPVDGTDVSGTTALAHSISTHPAFDPEFAQILYDAGGDVNVRNRYGATPAHDMSMILSLDEQDVRRMEEALRWFVTHGGNVDLKDGDGITARTLAETTARRFTSTEILLILGKEDKRRQDRREMCCAFCGREDAKHLLQCSRCKKAKYCEPSSRRCQKLDWPRHKSGCKTA